MTTTPLMRDVPLDVELRLRLLIRTLTWDLTGDDYAERAVSSIPSYEVRYKVCMPLGDFLETVFRA